MPFFEQLQDEHRRLLHVQWHRMLTRSSGGAGEDVSVMIGITDPFSF